MIWQTTWERHYVASYQSSLSEQVSEGEIELRNELPCGEFMPHGIYVAKRMRWRFFVAR